MTTSEKIAVEIVENIGVLCYIMLFFCFGFICYELDEDRKRAKRELQEIKIEATTKGFGYIIPTNGIFAWKQTKF